MDDQQKLRVLIPHWIEHNQEHADEFLRYIGAAGQATAHLQQAAVQMALVNQALAHALEQLGGAIPHEYLHEPHEHTHEPHEHTHEHQEHTHKHQEHTHKHQEHNH